MKSPARPQFGLKALFVLMTAAAVFLACYAAAIEYERAEARTRAKLSKLGEFYLDVVGDAIDFRGNATLRDEDLKDLWRLHEISVVSLKDTPITDQGVAHLHKCTRLDYVDLRGTRTSKDAARRLRQAFEDCVVDQ